MESFLTPKQKQLLEWIEKHLAEHQTMPSRREIALGLGLSSPATIQQHIEALEKKGYLKRGETRESRALQWTARSKKHFSQSAQAVRPEENSTVHFDANSNVRFDCGRLPDRSLSSNENDECSA